MNENFQGNFKGIKLAGATPNMVTFRGSFENFDEHPRQLYIGIPPGYIGAADRGIHYMFQFTLKRHELKQFICFLFTILD